MEGNTGESPKTSSINNIPRTTSPTNTATEGNAGAQQIETLLIHNIALHAPAIIQKREKNIGEDVCKCGGYISAVFST